MSPAPGMAMRITFATVFLLLASLCATTVQAVPISVPSVVISDRESDPLTRGTSPGALLMMRYRNATTFITSSALGFVDPEGFAIRPDRWIYVADSGADPLRLGEPRGAVWLVDPSERFDSSVARLIAASQLFVDPTDLLLESDGNLLLADPNADPYDRGARSGAIFRIDPATGNVSVVSASTLFSDPRSLARDTDGTVLVLDRTADPLGTGIRGGALFRLHPTSGAVVTVRAFDATQTRRLMAVAVLPDGDYAICDADADPGGSGTPRGAIFRLRKSTGRLETLIDSPFFSDPIDIAMGLGNELWALDQNSDFDNSPSTRGGVFGFDVTQGVALHAQSHPFLREPAALSFVDGPAIDSTKVTWTDVTGGGLQQGDVLTFRATIKSRGTRDARGVTVVDSLAGTWTFVAGSDSVSRGTFDFDPAAEVVRWTGDIPIGQEASVRFQLKLDSSYGAGSTVLDQVRISVDGATSFYDYRGTVETALAEGTVLFLDRARIQGDDGGIIYRIDPLSTSPQVIWSGNQLKEPLDAVFLDDGRLAILDRAAVPVQGASGSQAILLYDGRTNLRVVWTRQRDDGLLDPQGIALDTDGSLVLVDREANPFDLEYDPDPGHGDFGPGAVYRIDMSTGAATPWFSDSRMREPIAVGVDSRGIVVVDDFTGTNGNGDFWEYDRDADVVTRRPVNETWFRDPLGFTFDSQDNLLVADATHFNDGSDGTDNGTLFKLNRGAQTTYQILSQSALLVDPSDCWADETGVVYMTDRDANPLGLQDNDPGAVFRFDTRTNQLSVAAASVGLQRPAGPAGYSRLQVNAGALEVTDLNGGEAEGGDSLRVSLRFINASRRTVLGMFVDFEFGEAAHLLSLSASRPGIGYDLGDNRGSWVGSLARGDTLFCEGLLRIDEDVIYGQTATFSADLSYGSHTARRTATLPLRGRFPPGEMVLLDEAADPGRYGSSPGAIFRLSPDAGQALRVLFTGPPWVDPSAAEFGPDGTLYIADRRGNDPGRIYRIDTRTGLPVALLPDLPQLVNPIDLAFTPDGNLLIVDRDAVSQFPAAKGLVFRLDGTSEPLTVFAESPEFRSPGQLTFDDQGRLFLTDRAANPDSAAGNVGAIFELDPDDGSVLRHYQFEELPEPTGIDALADGTLLVTDAAANPRGYSGPHGTLFTLDPDAGTLRELLTHQSLIRPYRSHVRQQGTILVVDQSAAGPGQNGSPGTLFEFDPVSRTIRNYAQSDSFRSLSDLAEFPASLVAVSAYGVEDPDGPPLYPADRLTITAQIVNRGAVAAVGASYTDSLPEAARIVAGSITASEGTATVLGNAVYWGGTLAAGAVVDLSYDVQLDPFLAEGQILTFRGTAQGPHSEPRSAAQTVPVFVPLEGGSVYLADSAADPLGIGNQPGAIFKVNQRTGETTVYATYPQSRDPVDLALVGTARPMMYVIDQLFTLGAPARGGLFEIDPTTQESRLVAADSTWFRLEDVLPAGDDAVLVLDGFADPLHLTPTIGPGALYRVGLPEGNVELVYSDTTLTNPRAMTYLPDGRIAIVDADADPLDTGVRSGAVFAFDLSTKEIELIVAYPQWVDPSELTWTGEDLLVVDPSANPDPASQGFGSVWRVPLEGPVELYAVSDYFRRLGAIVSPTDGRPLLSDLDATIGTGTPLGGAVFRWSSRRTSNARFFPLAANRLLLQPQGMILFEDVTPVVYLPFEAAAESEGIALTWEGLSDPEDARYLVYRRAASGPEDDAVSDDYPVGYSLVATDEDYRGPGSHTAIDRDVDSGAWYVYRIAIVYHDGSDDYSPPRIVQAPASVLRFSLRPARPNPFAESVQLRFAIAREGAVRLTVHDVGGRRVAKIVDAVLPPGQYDRTWDGRTGAGNRAASGIYFARLEQNGSVLTERLVLLR